MESYTFPQGEKKKTKHTDDFLACTQTCQSLFCFSRFWVEDLTGM